MKREHVLVHQRHAQLRGSTAPADRLDRALPCRGCDAAGAAIAAHHPEAPRQPFPSDAPPFAHTSCYLNAGVA
jgi:hypothetical protein